MKLITSQQTLNKEFERLLHGYNQYYWAVAWASCPEKIFNTLLQNKSRIAKIVVGLHFYQTAPDFIKAFLGSKQVKFIEQTSGTFHPKMFLFYNSDSQWEMIIGSANFTREAFRKNTEASVLITSEDSLPGSTLKDAKSFIEQNWKMAITYNNSLLENYTAMYNRQRSKIKILSNEGHKNSTPNTLIHNVPIVNLTWKGFIQKVKNEKGHYYRDRVAVIELAQKLFKSVEHFCDLPAEARKFIAGIPHQYTDAVNLDGYYFGSMAGAGYFKQAIAQNNPGISKALDMIPQQGQITKKHYVDFVTEYSKVFDGNYIATSTRLLAMKRPDVFICFDSKNKQRLCKDFDIPANNMDYERYWTDIVETIFECEWWQNPAPSTKNEHIVSEARAAFLDSLYYVYE